MAIVTGCDTEFIDDVKTAADIVSQGSAQILYCKSI